MVSGFDFVRVWVFSDLCWVVLVPLAFVVVFILRGFTICCEFRFCVGLV